MINRYVAIFFSVLHVRYHAGITTDEMLSLPKSPFIVIGFLESIAVVSAMYAGGTNINAIEFSRKNLDIYYKSKDHNEA